MATKKTCIVIAGPTAVGKTALAIDLAQHFSTQIISADSRQCFIELDIGVAKPSPSELALVPHHFINSHSIKEPVNAAVFEKYALEKAREIFEQHDLLVMVGGTGLYIKAFCHGMDEVPLVPASIREKLVGYYEAKGLSWLQAEVQQQDPVFYASGETKNPQRLLRALEVKLSTGRSIREFQRQEPIHRAFNIIKIGLELPRAELYQRINSRVESMVQMGLEKEARELLPYKELNALQTVGYRELFDHFAGKISFNQAIEDIRLNTRHYAKRQMTWFKKDPDIRWCSPTFDQVLAMLKVPG